MIPSTHMLAGAVIGKNISNPIIIVLLSLIIHFIMDTFRHGDYLSHDSTMKEIVRRVGLDLFIGLSIIILYFYFNNPEWIIIRNIFIGIFASLFPDLLSFMYLKLNFKSLEKIFNFHIWIHRFFVTPKEKPWRLIDARNDIIFSILFIIILFFLKT